MQQIHRKKENKDVEDRIQSKYKIAAVNLCEIDHSFALEIEKVSPWSIIIVE